MLVAANFKKWSLTSVQVTGRTCPLAGARHVTSRQRTRSTNGVQGMLMLPRSTFLLSSRHSTSSNRDHVELNFPELFGETEFILKNQIKWMLSFRNEMITTCSDRAIKRLRLIIRGKTATITATAASFSERLPLNVFHLNELRLKCRLETLEPVNWKWDNLCIGWVLIWCLSFVAGGLCWWRRLSLPVERCVVIGRSSHIFSKEMSCHSGASFTLIDSTQAKLSRFIKNFPLNLHVRVTGHFNFRQLPKILLKII